MKWYGMHIPTNWRYEYNKIELSSAQYQKGKKQKIQR